MITLVVLISVALLLVACGNRMSPEEIEAIKIDQTIGRYMDGYVKKDSVQILDATNLENSQKVNFQMALDELLKVLHRDPYTIKISYQIDDTFIEENNAEIKLSAILRIFKEEDEMISLRLFKDQNMQLVKDAEGEWKINFKQFIPQELLTFDFLF